MRATLAFNGLRAASSLWRWQQNIVWDANITSLTPEMWSKSQFLMLLIWTVLSLSVSLVKEQLLQGFVLQKICFWKFRKIGRTTPVFNSPCKDLKPYYMRQWNRCFSKNFTEVFRTSVYCAPAWTFQNSMEEEFSNALRTS